MAEQWGKYKDMCTKPDGAAYKSASANHKAASREGVFVGEEAFAAFSVICEIPIVVSARTGRRIYGIRSGFL